MSEDASEKSFSGSPDEESKSQATVLLVEVDDDIGASKAVLRILREDGLRKKIVAQGLEDVHNRFNARRVSEEHSKLFNKEMD